MSCNKVVVYTCLVGKYDELLQPLVVEEDFDYICFSNDIKADKVGVWTIRPIPFAHHDSTRLSRYVKLNPHVVLKEYDYSIWIDANIEIVGDLLYKRVRELMATHVLVSQVKHPFYDCIYKDIIECIKFHKDKFCLLVRQYNFLKKEGFPEHYGLFENNLIFRKHSDSLIVQVSEMWWDIYCRYAKRDQFSLCYVYWKLNVSPVLFLKGNESTRNNINFSYRNHNINMSFVVKVQSKIWYWIYSLLLLFIGKWILLK